MHLAICIVKGRVVCNQEKGFNAHNAYSLSKLAMMMFNTELAARLSPPPTANCLDPGTVNTKMLLQGGLISTQMLSIGCWTSLLGGDTKILCERAGCAQACMG